MKTSTVPAGYIRFMDAVNQIGISHVTFRNLLARRNIELFANPADARQRLITLEAFRSLSDIIRINPRPNVEDWS